MIVWVDGALIDEREARISPFDHGLTVGDGAFETLRVYGGVPFAWRRHMQRLASSARALGLSLPDAEALRDAASRVIDANGLPDARLRITITGGIAPLGSARGEGGLSQVVAAGPFDAPAPAERVAMAPWPRNERGALTGIKSTSYAENVRALAWAGERGAGEAIFANTRDDLCEGTGTNVFLVEGERVVTPPLSAGCLAGVTRAIVLELCASLGVDAAEEDRPAASLAGAEEAFLTSTIREVQPIGAVDEHTLPAAPGAITAKLAAAFTELVRTTPDP